MRHFVSVILCSCFLAACSSPMTPQDISTASARWATLVKQDANLYRIDDKLYRSEQPVAEDGELIEQLGIRSVINLRFFDRNDNETHLKGRNLMLLNRPLLTWKIKPKDIAQTLFLIEKQQKYGPVLVHCYHGADRTGLISGMYRIIYQGWSVEEARLEMQHGPYGYHSIWKNIENLFTEEKVQEVREHLERLRKEG